MRCASGSSGNGTLIAAPRPKVGARGNILVVVGARTGRDGIHGASFASEELTEQSEARRPQVQVGDPFTEKLLLEASLELIGSGLIVAIQDMGAAGLTSSSAEMAARGGVGVEIDLARVPTREPHMTPYEILLSESQERMLVVAEPERLEDIRRIAARWDLEATAIGRVTADGVYRATWGEDLVVSIPGRALVEDCPVYDPEAREDRGAAFRRAEQPSGVLPPVGECLVRLLDRPAVASKRWIFEQYDSTVQASTVLGPGGDAARGAGARRAVRDRALRRLQRPLCAAQPLRRREGDGGRSGPERRLHGRAAPGDHRLPQLRQP